MMRNNTTIERKMRYFGISREELAKMLRMSVRTLHRRLADPTTWTVGEMNRLGGIFGWTREDFADFVESCSR